jgi:hypothetical protein
VVHQDQTVLQEKAVPLALVEAQAVPVAQVLPVLMEAQEYLQQAVLPVQAVHLDQVDQMVHQVLMAHQDNLQLQEQVALLDPLVQQG